LVRKQNKGLKIHNSETKRAREAEQIKENGIQQLKANTKLVGGRAIKRGVVGEKTENQGKAYMWCHPMKERSAEEAPDANVPRTDSALPLFVAISIRCFKNKADLGSLESNPQIGNDLTLKLGPLHPTPRHPSFL